MIVHKTGHAKPVHEKGYAANDGQGTAGPRQPEHVVETPFDLSRADERLARLAWTVYHRPQLFSALCAVKRARTKTALLLAAWCLVEGIYDRERPLDWMQPNVWLGIGLLLILGGLAFRLAALGCLRKKQHLATYGVYSRCRHPLYLGSILLSYGFCVPLADSENYILATAYFVIFYPLTIFWEEVCLSARYGKAHRRYREQTSLLLPLGTFRAGRFSWTWAMSQGGAALLTLVITMVIGVQVMAKSL